MTKGPALVHDIQPATQAAFEDFVRTRSAALVRTAWLLTGDEAAAYDLVQQALIKTWTRWTTIRNKTAPEAFVRTVILSTFMSARRRRWIHEKPSSDVVSGTPAAGDSADEVATRLTVQRALTALSAGQRAVIVLRYFDDLSEAQTAELLRCSVGTVKSQAARALARLRADRRLDELWTGDLGEGELPR